MPVKYYSTSSREEWLQFYEDRAIWVQRDKKWTLGHSKDNQGNILFHPKRIYAFFSGQNQSLQGDEKIMPWKKKKLFALPSTLASFYPAKFQIKANCRATYRGMTGCRRLNSYLIAWLFFLLQLFLVQISFPDLCISKDAKTSSDALLSNLDLGFIHKQMSVLYTVWPITYPFLRKATACLISLCIKGNKGNDMYFSWVAQDVHTACLHDVRM